MGEVKEGTVEMVDRANRQLAGLPLEFGDLSVLERAQEGEGSGGDGVVQ